MFQFPHLPPGRLCVQRSVTGYHPGRVAPFGYPRIFACPQLPEAFRRLATSFIGLRRLGIHRVLFMRLAFTIPGVPTVTRRSTMNGTAQPPASSSDVATTPRAVSARDLVTLHAHGAPMLSVVKVPLSKKQTAKLARLPLPTEA
jgi:hypothetical protein